MRLAIFLTSLCLTACASHPLQWLQGKDANSEPIAKTSSSKLPTQQDGAVSFSKHTAQQAAEQVPLEENQLANPQNSQKKVIEKQPKLSPITAGKSKAKASVSSKTSALQPINAKEASTQSDTTNSVPSIAVPSITAPSITAPSIAAPSITAPSKISETGSPAVVTSAEGTSHTTIKNTTKNTSKNSAETLSKETFVDTNSNVAKASDISPHKKTNLKSTKEMTNQQR